MKCRMLEIFVTGRLSSIGTLIVPISWGPSSPRLLVTSGDWCGGDIVRLCSSVSLCVSHLFPVNRRSGIAYSWIQDYHRKHTPCFGGHNIQNVKNTRNSSSIVVWMCILNLDTKITKSRHQSF